MVCHAPLFPSANSFDNYCAKPKIQRLTMEMAVGYECAACFKLASKEREASIGESSDVKGNEKKAAAHAKAKSTDQNITEKHYGEGLYIEDEFDAWHIGMAEAGSSKGKGNGKENVKRDPSVVRSGGRDVEGRSSSAARKGSKDSGNSRDGYTNTTGNLEISRARSRTPYGGGRRSGNTKGS